MQRYLYLLLICLFTCPVFAQVNLTNGLVAHYTFSGNSNDVSGNGHHGTLVNGPVLTTDRFGNSNSAYFFDGANDYIRVTDNGSFSTSQISISLWFKTNSDALQNLIGKRSYTDDGTPAGGAQYQFFINYAPFPGIGSNLVGNNGGNTCANISGSSYINTNDVICKNRWYHAVITFDGTLHKIYIDGILRLTSNTGFNAMLSCLSELRFGVWWTAGTIPFSGTMDDIRWYNRPLNHDEVTALFDNFPQSSSADFSYTQNSCDPKIIQFTNLTTNTTLLSWDFGNNTTNTGNAMPSVTYAAYGNYNVKLKVHTSSGCIDSVTKTIPVNVQQDSMITKADTTICLGASVQLNTLPSLSYCWGSTPGLSNTNITNPVATPATTSTYYFTAQSMGNNIVVNGNFSSGNTGFTSDYIHSMPGNTAAAQYGIGSNPNSWWFSFPACGDHTTGTGNMMMVNGSSTIGAKVWQQTITVAQNTNYAFSTWVKSLHSISPANLRFSINNNVLGNNIMASSLTCDWKQFYTTWNSGTNTTATITIINNNTAFNGNDFALDDISFSAVLLKQDSIKITVVNSMIPDFNFSQSTCDPKTIQFNNITPASTVSWNFGNGSPNSSSQSPVITYTSFGNYNVTLTTAGSCGGTITKNIPVAVQQDSLIIKADTTICRGASVQLSTFPALDLCWGNQPGLSNYNIGNPVATPVNTTTYYSNAQATGTNLVVNGDFSSGNSGFTSDYTSQFPNTTEAVYWISNDPVAWNGAFSSCVEHTTGTGNMMMVNGSPVAGAKVWSQTITVLPNTNYAFSVWIQSLAAMNPANLRFSINGNVLGNNIGAGNTACQWSRFYTTWNSGNTTSAIITIVNNNTIAAGNDFAIDDISFSQVFLKQDSIKITVTDPPDISVSSNSSVCPGEPVVLNASGAANISWTYASTLSDPNIPDPTATPTVTTKYIVSGYDFPGCIGKDSVTITVKDTPVITRISDTAFCRGSSPVTIFASAPNATTYTWSPSTGLTDPNSNSTVANPASSQTYYLQVTGTNGCKSHDSVKVAVLDVPVVDVRPDTSICPGIQTILSGTSSGGNIYSWSPSTGLSNAGIMNPLASPASLTKYILTVSNAACSAKDSVTIGIKPLPVVTKSIDTTICSGGEAQLFATGGISYEWTPSAGLDNNLSSTPVASPNSAQKYYVKVTGANGCDKTDSVSVGWQPKPVFTINPVTTAICIGDSTTLTANGADTYNWFAGSNILSPGSASTIVHPDNTQQFAVAVRHNMCRINDTLRSAVTVNALPTTTASKSNDIDCSNASATLSATGGVSYSWFPQTGMSAGNTANPVASPLVTTTYYVNVTNSNGCSEIDSVNVVVLFNPNGTGYHVANAFSPNNDNKNDCFGLKYWGVVQSLDFAVYNRWGQMIFHTSNPSACWDGNFKGIPQASGTYAYQVKAKTACGDVYKKGTVVLMR